MNDKVAEVRSQPLGL